jgi:lipopolysaccharide/colanic/teichoic acid biosynthesis glycosyltransferase
MRMATDQRQGVGDVDAGYSPVSVRKKSGVLYIWTKRALDIAGSSLLLVLLSPLLLIVSLAIKLDSPGPVLFIQQRVGSKRTKKDPASWERRPFRIYKFRSMFHESDESLHEKYIKEFVNGNVEASDDRAKFKLNGDRRITRVGRFIRRASIDELPQLLNVWKGEMSLVGPRPVPQYEVDEYLPWHYERLDALPGMTGFWQVHGRGRVEFDEMMRMDIEYVRAQSIWLDLKLLLLTIPAVLRGSGAE